MNENALIKFDKPEDALEFIKDPSKITAAVFGALASDKSEWVLSTGRILQAGLKLRAFKQLGEEINSYTQKGAIKENFLEKDVNQSSFYELLKFIDEETPDEERARAMKSIFFSSITPNSGSAKEQLAYEFLQICKELSSGEILILKASFSLFKKGVFNANMGDNRDAWLSILAKEIGHNIPALIAKYEDHLMSLKLIEQRVYNDGSGFRKTPYGRLTESGYQLCQFIIEFQ